MKQSSSIAKQIEMNVKKFMSSQKKLRIEFLHIAYLCALSFQQRPQPDKLYPFAVLLVQDIPRVK
jgi:hypothetical protein